VGRSRAVSHLALIGLRPPVGSLHQYGIRPQRSGATHLRGPVIAADDQQFLARRGVLTRWIVVHAAVACLGRRARTLLNSGPAAPHFCVTTLEMKRNPQDLEKIAHLTLEHYNQYAEEFWQGTRDHDVSQNIAALLQYIRNEPPFKILDFGCGPGRDLKTFAELGHITIGLEGAEHLAVMARAHSGCEVW